MDILPMKGAHIVCLFGWLIKDWRKEVSVLAFIWLFGYVATEDEG